MSHPQEWIMLRSRRILNSQLTCYQITKAALTPPVLLRGASLVIRDHYKNQTKATTTKAEVAITRWKAFYYKLRTVLDEILPHPVRPFN